MDRFKQVIQQVKEYEDNNCFELKTSVVLHWLKEIENEALAISVVTTRLFFFDCWKGDGKLETKEIEATCEEHAILKFEKEFGEDYGFDPPYC